MAVKIPKDVSGLRKAMAEAAARARRSKTATNTTPEKKPDVQKQRLAQSASEDRKRARDAEATIAELRQENEELKGKLSDTEAKVTEFQPHAERWQKYSHREKELLVARFPKEEQARARKMDVEDLRYLAEKAGYLVASTGGKATEEKSTGFKITGPEDLAKATPEVANKFMDDVVAGKIKLDGDGKVIG